MPAPLWRLRVTIILIALSVLLTSVLDAAPDQYALSEPVDDQRIRAVSAKLDVTGQITPTIAVGKTGKPLPLSVEAKFRFRERRLSGAGRDARTLRGVRYYEEVAAKIRVGDRETAPRLQPGHRLIAALGTREGVERYCPSAPLSRPELDLLQTPGDSLALLVLLPTTPVTIRDTWTPESWAVQMLSGVEAATKTELTCKLISVERDVAKVSFAGKVEGATLGAAASLTVNGHYLFDLKQKLITHAEITQTELRDSGPYNPAMNVKATMIVDRKTTDDVTPLSDVLAKELPLEPTLLNKALVFRPPWNIELIHDRNWHLFHQTSAVAVLRLLDETGAFVSQCSIAPIVSAKPGEHTSEQQFQNDIRTSLGTQLKEITKAELIDSKDGRFLYRVTAVGEANKRPLTWFYYLCAAPSGRQVSLVFVVDTKYVDRLGNRDLEIVNSLQFLTRGGEPTPAN